jgi:hypothetical protein
MSDTVTKLSAVIRFAHGEQWLASNRTQNDDDFCRGAGESSGGASFSPSTTRRLNGSGVDAEVLDEILQQFLDNATQQIIDMKAALTVEDFDMLRKKRTR